MEATTRIELNGNTYEEGDEIPQAEWNKLTPEGKEQLKPYLARSKKKEDEK